MTTPAPAPANQTQAAQQGAAPTQSGEAKQETKPSANETPKQAELKLPPPLVASEGAPPAEGTKPAEDAKPAESESVFTEWPEGLEENVKTALGELGKDLAKELELDGGKQTKAMKALVGKWQSAQAEAAKRAEQAFVDQAHAFTKAAADHQVVKKLGGLDKARTLAASALTAHGSKALSEVLAQSGLAYHPEVVAFFASVGAKLSEDSVAGATSQARSAPSREEQLRATYTHPTSRSMFKE